MNIKLFEKIVLIIFIGILIIGQVGVKPTYAVTQSASATKMNIDWEGISKVLGSVIKVVVEIITKLISGIGQSLNNSQSSTPQSDTTTTTTTKTKVTGNANYDLMSKYKGTLLVVPAKWNGNISYQQQQNNINQMINILRSEGLNDAQIAAMLGNVRGESRI